MLNVKVLGPGCQNCHTLEARVVEALEMLDVEATIQHVTDRQEYPKYRLLFTPGLVVNEKLVVAGRVPETREIVTLLTTALAEAG